jgi:hypothetical protein
MAMLSAIWLGTPIQNLAGEPCRALNAPKYIFYNGSINLPASAFGEQNKMK